MVEVFRTTVQEHTQAKAILSMLTESYPDFKINFDLSDCDKILRVEGKNIVPEKIIELLRLNRYECEVLN